ncbi:hypothetical protein [Neorhodopirellula lusitana]|uniref:hypothetical protein n=1 Tax=Neorhodopirellula lusitana TaxID=445327 RepID=UPI0038514342
MPPYSHLVVRLLKTAVINTVRESQKASAASSKQTANEAAPASSNSTSSHSRASNSTSAASAASRERQNKSPNYRRLAAGGLAALLLSVAAIGAMTTWMETWFGSQSTRDFVIAAMTRIGLVLGAIWLAWDSMRRPASWFPPGLAMAGVVGIVVVAAQPKLILAVVPLLGGLAVLSSVLRAFRGR